MNVIDTKLEGVKIIEPDVFGDDRGFFQETYQRERYRDEVNIDLEFVQDNHSRSSFGVLRGLHAQVSNPQGKLVRVVRGSVFDVIADGNPTSPTFGEWVGVEISAENHRQLWVSPGYLHGFVVTSDYADFEYKCTAYYDPKLEIGVRWDDPFLNIDWPIAEPALSAKDLELPFLKI